MKKFKSNSIAIVGYALLPAVIFCGCHNNERHTIEWIKQAEKPVICTEHSMNLISGGRYYTLIDADGNIYNTCEVEMKLPDTITAKK